MVRCMSLVVCLCIGLGPGYARVHVQPVAPFDPAPIEQPPVRLSLPAPPVLRANDRPPAALTATERVAGPALHMPDTDNPALVSEVERLRATAVFVAPGARAGRAQASASWVLGLLYLHGIGVATNSADAASWFERARTLGEPLAFAGLAWCEIEGCQGAANPVAARPWIALLRPVNLPRAQYLQWLVETRLAPLQIAAPGLRNEMAVAVLPSRPLLLSAAQGGDIQAQIELGFESVAANRLADAQVYFRAAAPRSSVAAANAALLSDRIAGFSNTSRPTAGANVSSNDTLALARRNHRGEGRPANFAEAIRLYRIAQSQGNDEARKMLELIFSRPGPNGQIDIAWMQHLAYVNLSGEAVSLDSATAWQTLRREPTALSDLLPQTWRQYASGLRR